MSLVSTVCSWKRSISVGALPAQGVACGTHAAVVRELHGELHEARVVCYVNSRPRVVVAASPSTSCGNRLPPGWSGGGSGARRRASLDPLDLLGEERLRLLEYDDGRRLGTATTTTPRPPTSRRSPQHHQQSPMSLEMVERSSAGGERQGREGVADAVGADGREPADAQRPLHGESSRAKERRSQSAPRQRIAASESGASVASASPSPSCGERQLLGWSGGAQRRASLDPLDLLGARCSSAAGRVQGAIECGSSAWRD
ncbi:hypothetical protein EJB05_53065, partial [Eragrostis curvula]